jgi:hypothetical protein
MAAWCHDIAYQAPCKHLQLPSLRPQLTMSQRRTSGRRLHTPPACTADSGLPYQHFSGQTNAASSGSCGDAGSSCDAAASRSGHGPLARLRALVAQHGAGAVFAYLTLSNLMSCGALAVSWALFVRATGQSPLAQGAWPKFALACTPLYLSGAVRPCGACRRANACAPLPPPRRPLLARRRTPAVLAQLQM